jgi:ribosome modulation factor
MRLAMDEQAWSRGFEDGRQGKPLNNCPYGACTDERLSWISGYIEGKAARNGYTVVRAVPRQKPTAVPLPSAAPVSAAE